ncbi:MAG: glycosyltransferase [Deltaproteobacteria bacterium]|nr:glycosyltransferase [Deltaproteobacteria bacterium]
MARVLFAYVVEDNLGILAKSKKIELGFLNKGYKLDIISCILHENKGIKLLQLMKFHFSFFMHIMNREYNVIFIRNGYFLFGIYLLCFLLKKKIQIDINTREKEEFLTRGQSIRALFAEASRYMAMRCASRVHPVTKELMSYYSDMHPGVDFVYNPNFAVHEFYTKKNTRAPSEKMNVVFLGNTNQKWQGIDLFIKKAIAGNSWFLENCRFHIIGSCSEEIASLIESHSLKNIVITHGYVEGSAKDELMATMDIGVGSFNLAHKSITEATPIKVAEYLFSGLPVIIGYKDNRLDQNLPFVLNIPDISKQADAHELVNRFILHIRDNQHLREEAHIFALNNLTVDRYVDKIIDKQS